MARVHTARVHTRRLFFWDVSIRNSLRSNKWAQSISTYPDVGFSESCDQQRTCYVQPGWSPLTKLLWIASQRYEYKVSLLCVFVRAAFPLELFLYHCALLASFNQSGFNIPSQISWCISFHSILPIFLMGCFGCPPYCPEHRLFIVYLDYVAI